MMNSKTNEMICDICGKDGTRIIHLSKSYGKDEHLLVIENIPIISCTDCGESYLTAKTLREIDNIKQNSTSGAVKRPVPVAILA